MPNPTKAELEAKERTLNARDNLESNLDELIKLARAGVDTEAMRTIVLSCVDALIGCSHAERSAYRDAVVAEYQRLANGKPRVGHA